MSKEICQPCSLSEATLLLRKELTEQPIESTMDSMHRRCFKDQEVRFQAWTYLFQHSQEAEVRANHHWPSSFARPVVRTRTPAFWEVEALLLGLEIETRYQGWSWKLFPGGKLFRTQDWCLQEQCELTHISQTRVNNNQERALLARLKRKGIQEEDFTRDDNEIVEGFYRGIRHMWDAYAGVE